MIAPQARETAMSAAKNRKLIEDIAQTPAALRAAIKDLSPEQIETPYREGGWTLRQVVHHVPDSHVNAYCRFKLALTEDSPTIRPYDEGRWAELADSHDTPIKTSLALLESLHYRWVCLLRAMKPADFERLLDQSLSADGPTLIGVRIDDKPGTGQTRRDPVQIREQFMIGLGTRKPF